MNSISQTYSLYSILNRLKSILHEQTQNKNFWVKAQILNRKMDRNGNVYLDIIESKNEKIIAKCEAIIWANSFSTILNKISATDNQILKEGTELLFYATIDYSEVFGIKLLIFDIDHNYAIGEIEKRKQQNLAYLKEHHLLQLNKQTYLPSVVQKIAVIASPNTAGYLDFINQITKNQFHFNFHLTLFPSNVQGEKAALEIIKALEVINHNEFDCIVIIRGGGSKFDLDQFNNLDLAIKIAQSKCPVLTGIGHETDISIADLVAHTYVKTPTALAAHLVEIMHLYWLKVTNMFSEILARSNEKLKGDNYKFKIISQQIVSNSKQYTQNNILKLNNFQPLLTQYVNYKMQIEFSFLKNISNKIAFENKILITNNLSLLNDHIYYFNTLSINLVKFKMEEMFRRKNLLDHFVSNKFRNEKFRIERFVEIPEMYSQKNILKFGYAIVKVNSQIFNANTKLKNYDEVEIEILDKKVTFNIHNIKEELNWKDTHTNLQQKN